MNTTTPHPAPEQLVAFGNGTLPEADIPVVAAHLEICETCHRTVAGISPNSFIRLIQGAELTPHRPARRRARRVCPGSSLVRQRLQPGPTRSRACGRQPPAR